MKKLISILVLALVITASVFAGDGSLAFNTGAKYTHQNAYITNPELMAMNGGKAMQAEEVGGSWFLNLDGDYFFTENIGIAYGFGYERFFAAADVTSSGYYDLTSDELNSMSGTFTLSVGPAYRWDIMSRFHGQMSVEVFGQFSSVNSSSFAPFNSMAVKRTDWYLGAAFDLSAKIDITQKFFVNIGFNTAVALLKSVDLTLTHPLAGERFSGKLEFSNRDAHRISFMPYIGAGFRY